MSKKENMIKELLKLGITNENELYEAIKKQPPLDITLMASPNLKKEYKKSKQGGK